MMDEVTIQICIHNRREGHFSSGQDLGVSVGKFKAKSIYLPLILMSMNLTNP